MIVFACGGCGLKLQVKDELAGKDVQCAKCGHSTSLAAATPAAVAVDDARTLPPWRPAVSTNTPGAPSPANAAEAVRTPANPKTGDPRFDSAADAGPAEAPAVLIPGYEVLGELGRGGMGVVYKARQSRLRRLVALKMILAGGHAGKTDLDRFRTEAEAIARLQHPNIVQIHEVGEHEGKPFFSLEFCAGGTLESKLDGTPWQSGAAAGLIATLARAMHAAHRQQVVHRDLKPANVLLLADGTPKITDFGLAKKLDEQGGTRTGSVLGTASYMAPEQASEAKTVGPAADIYALGALLYELLTGRPPFKAATALDTVIQVLTLQPVPPRQLQPMTPRDLETICLKCLQKAPARRYETAEALAQDLDRFQAGTPILARPVGAVERGLRWVRRNPLVAGLAAALLLALTAGLVASTLFAVQARQEARRADEQARQAEREARAARRAEGKARTAAATARQKEQAARAAEGKASAAKSVADREARAARAAEGKARAAKAEADREARAARRREYDANLLLVQNAWERHQVRRFLELLESQKPRSGQEDLRGFEWHYWKKRFRRGHLTLTGHLSSIAGVAFRPDGKRLASACLDGTIKLWDVATGQEVRTLTGHTFGVKGVAFSPDGKWLASAGQDRTVRLWDATTGEPRHTLKGHTAEVLSVAFSPDSKYLASSGGAYLGGKDGSVGCEVKVWNPATGALVHKLKGHRWMVNCMAFSPDGKTLASGSGFVEPNAYGATGGEVRLWDAATGRELRTLKGHTLPVVGVAFSPDRKRLVTVGGQTLKVWDLGTGQEVLTREHACPVSGMALSPDGLRLAVADSDWLVKVWDLATGQEALVLKGHNLFVSSLAFSPDGKRLATASWDRTVKVWDLVAGQQPLTRNLNVRRPGLREVLSWRANTPSTVGVAFSPDSKRLAATCLDGPVKVWDVAAGQELHVLQGHTGPGPGVAFSPDGKRLAATSWDGTVKFWDAASGKEDITLRVNTGIVFGLAFSPDGRRLATASAREVRVWDTSTGRGAAPFKGHQGEVVGVAFSPDGRRLASASFDKTVKVWNAATGRELLTLNADALFVLGVVFSFDGKRLASAHWDGTVRLWDAASGRALFTLKGHTAAAAAVAFSPDGKRLASASWDRTVKVWDTATGQECLTLRGHTEQVRAVAFSRDGKRLASAGLDLAVKVWDADSGE
jgi:WD40 repeat protein